MPSVEKRPFRGAQNSKDHRQRSLFVDQSDVEVAIAAGFTMDEVAYMLDLLPGANEEPSREEDESRSMPPPCINDDEDLLEQICDIVTENPKRCTGPMFVRAAVRCIVEHRPLAEKVELRIIGGASLSEDRINALYDLLRPARSAN